MAITAAMVKELRELTGAGMMDCKKALGETDGNMDEAVEYLRKNGQAKAEKKASRIAAEGLCTVVVKDDKTAAVVEVNSETDFVAKNETFQQFVKAVAEQAVESDAADMDAFMEEKWNEDPSKTVKDALVEKVAVIGDFAKTPRYQGAGSSLVNPTKQPESILDVIGDSGLVMTAYEQGYIRNRKPNAALAKSAVEAAKNADVVLVFAGLDEISESEGLDRTHMHMPQAQNELIDEITAVNSNVVVVLSAGSSIEMPWFDYVKGIVHGYLGGQAGASAMMNVLTGKVCPSGKLNETYPLHYEDTPAFHYYPSKERSSEYREALYVGYRYYTTVGKKVRFPFGYGLSYTTFAYSNFSVDKDGVTFTIKNTGDVEGTEIAQLYVGKKSETIFRPVRELKGFARVTLAPGEEKSVHIAFDDKTFRFYDTRTDTWEVESGNYQIMVGTDADTMVLVGSLDVAGTVAEGGYSKEILPEYFSGKIENVDDIEYRELYGREIPDGSWSGEIQMNDAVCQLYYGKGIFGKLFYGVLKLLLKISEWQGKPNLNVLFNYNMPIRGYAKMTGGFVTMEMARALTEMANGHRIKGTAHLIKAAVKRD